MRAATDCSVEAGMGSSDRQNCTVDSHVQPINFKLSPGLSLIFHKFFLMCVQFPEDRSALHLGLIADEVSTMSGETCWPSEIVCFFPSLLTREPNAMSSFDPKPLYSLPSMRPGPGRSLCVAFVLLAVSLKLSA